MNLVVLHGRLGKDPEGKSTQSGVFVVNMSVATNRRVKGEDVTDWHRVVAFGKTAEFAEQYLTKGREVLVQGYLQTRSWETGSGERRYMTEVVANRLQAVGPRPEQTARPAEEVADTANTFDDDIPF